MVSTNVKTQTPGRAAAGLLALSLLAYAFGPATPRARSQQPQSQQPQGQRPQNQPPPAPPTLGLEQGYLELDTPDFTLKLVKASQTVAALRPKGAGAFDFTPADRLEMRAADGFHHLGDLTFRARRGGSGPWQDYSTAAVRKPVL